MRTTRTLLSIGALLAALSISVDTAAQSKSAPRTPSATLRRTGSQPVDGALKLRQQALRPLPGLSTGKHMADQSIGSSELRGAAPANDNCANATLLTVGTSCAPVNGTVDQATQSIAGVDCATFIGNANDDVWYRFVANGPNVTIVLECNETFDGVIDLRSGACNGTNIDCMDNFIAGGSETLLATGLTSGTTYRFRVYDFEAGYPVDPTFSVCVFGTPAAPANDLCEDAVIQDLNVPGSVSVSGDNTGATDTEGIGSATVWEAFTIDACANVTVDYCGTDPVFENAFLALADDCSLVNVIDLVDDGDCGDGNFRMTVAQLPAGTYWFPVLTEAGSEGAYTIEFSATACGGGNGPANDLCSSATPVDLEVGSPVGFTGTTVDATAAGDFVPGSGLDVGGDTTTVWHAFTTTECSDISVSYCGTDPLPASYWAFLSDACPAGDDVLLFDNGNFTDCADGNATIFFFNVPAGTYYLPVRGEPATAGPYQLEVTATACANAGPYCDAGAAVTGFETIGQVVFAGLDNTSAGIAGYEDFTSVAAAAMQGQTYPLDIVVDNGFPEDQALVWIDFDQSDSFEPAELVFTSAIGEGPYSGSIAIPADATLGQTRMRIRLHDTHDGTDYQNTPNATPCDTSTFGQVEDYTVNILGQVDPPANDQCGDVTAEELTVGGALTFTGDNSGATIDGDYQAGSEIEGLGLPSVWHAFTTTECANVTVSYCATAPAFLNAWVVLATDCPTGDDLVFNSSWNTTECGNDNITISYINLPAGTYYLPVMMDLSTETLAVGPYEVEVSASACLAGPINDDCAGAIMLDVNITCQPTQGTVENATESLPAIVCNNFEGIANDDVWYAFVATGPNQTITVNGTDTLDAVIELFEGTCGDLSSLACADGTIGGGVEVIETNDLVEGTTYFVRVYDFYNGYPIEPTFDICVTGDVGTAVVDAEAGVFTLRPNPAQDQVTIGVHGFTGNVRVDILDVAGRLVQTEQRGVATGGNIVLDLSNGISAGVYTVRLSTADQRAEQRLIVE